MVVISSILIIICSIFIINKRIEHRTRTSLRKDMQVESIPSSVFSLEMNNRIDEREIYQLIRSSTKLEKEDWERIELFVNQSQDCFVEKLRQAYTSLSEDDIRIILLIRLGLEHKEIALFYNILLSSFRKRRSRLKKKMKVECESLSRYIRTLYT